MKTIWKTEGKICLTEIITVTMWFHGKGHRGLEAVAVHMLQVWWH